jgi:hypothetical protein
VLASIKAGHSGAIISANIVLMGEIPLVATSKKFSPARLSQCGGD